jgi:RND family efflux transporter MFP subunit
MKNIYIPAVMIVFSLFASCSSDKKEKVESVSGIVVKLGGVSAAQAGSFVTASGKTEAEKSAEISTRMMGFITKIHVKVGQPVNQGQLLVSINNTDLLAKKAQVDAGILQATAAYNNAKKDYDRFVNLYKDQSASQKELDDILARFEMTKAALESAREMKKEVMAQFSYSNITAPFAGIVTNTFVKEGVMANPGMPIMSIEGASRLQVTAMVSESDIAEIKNGMPAKILIKSINKEVDGKVSEVSLSAKNTGSQYLVKLDLDKIDPSILAGMFVNVQFPVQRVSKSEQVLIPETALVYHGQLTGIYTVGSENTAILRWLRTGRKIGDRIEILSGLTSEEQYIISSEGKLYNGAKVSIQ